MPWATIVASDASLSVSTSTEAFFQFSSAALITANPGERIALELKVAWPASTHRLGVRVKPTLDGGTIYGTVTPIDYEFEENSDPDYIMLSVPPEWPAFEVGVRMVSGSGTSTCELRYIKNQAHL